MMYILSMLGIGLLYSSDDAVVIPGVCFGVLASAMNMKSILVLLYTLFSVYSVVTS